MGLTWDPIKIIIVLNISKYYVFKKQLINK